MKIICIAGGILIVIKGGTNFITKCHCISQPFHDQFHSISIRDFNGDFSRGYAVVVFDVFLEKVPPGAFEGKQ